MVRIIIFLLISLFSISLNAKDVIFRKANKVKTSTTCNKDNRNICQDKIVNLINHTKNSLIINNYDFSNQAINIAIGKVLSNGIYTIIYTNALTANKFKAVFDYYITKNTIIYITNIEYYKLDQLIIVDGRFTIRGSINHTLRTEKTQYYVSTENPPEDIQFIDSNILAKTFINKLEYHISHAELYVDNTK